jgi:tetrahydromethanopterin S-methyltransferase subunit G
MKTTWREEVNQLRHELFKKTDQLEEQVKRVTVDVEEIKHVTTRLEKDHARLEVDIFRQFQLIKENKSSRECYIRVLVSLILIGLIVLLVLTK